MQKQLFAAINRDTGTIIGLTDSKTESTNIDLWPLDEECLVFLEALQKYMPNHTHTLDDIKWFYETFEIRTSFGWELLPSGFTKNNEITHSSKLRFKTWQKCSPSQ